MIVLRFDMITAFKEKGSGKTPSELMREAGYKVIAAEGAPIADCIFFGVEKLIEPLPNWLEVSDYPLTAGKFESGV